MKGIEKFDKKKYDKAFKKRYIKQIIFDCNIEKDKDILNHLENQSNKAKYLKDLIRKDIEK